jgi:hypothetical protein
VLGTSLAVPHVACAQTASGGRLIAVDRSFQPVKPNDVTPKGLSIQSGARQRGLTALRNLRNVTGLVERPGVRSGQGGGSDGSRNVLVNDPTLDNIQSFPGFLPSESSVQQEPSVAVFGKHVLIGYNSSANSPVVQINGELFYTQIFWSAYSISHDGGRTFTSGFVPPTADSPFTFGDPSVGVDRAGRFFYSSLGASTGADGFLHGAVQINRSDDYGNTFGTGVTVAIDDGVDKDWLAIGPDPNVPSRDNLYITWTRFKDLGQETGSSELWLSSELRWRSHLVIEACVPAGR